MSADHGPKTDPDPIVNITLKILYVSPQLSGQKPIDDEGHAIIEEISALRRNGKLSEYQISLLDQMGRAKSLDDDYDF